MKLLKNLFNLFFCITSLIGAFFLYNQYDVHAPKAMPFIGSMAEPFSGSGVHISAKAYSQKESYQYLSRNLHRRGYIPIQVTLQNNTPKTYILYREGVQIDSHTHGQVATRISSTSLPRSLGLKIASFLFPPFIIPSAIDSVYSIHSHVRMRQDYHAKSIKEEGEYLYPYSTVHRVLYVQKKNYADQFMIHLGESNSQYIYPFQVKVYSY